MSDQGRVLVEVRERRHPVVISSVDELVQDRLMLEIRKVFSDVISDEEDFFLQCQDKDERYDQFVDLAPGQTVSNKSVLRAVFKGKKVCVLVVCGCSSM